MPSANLLAGQIGQTLAGTLMFTYINVNITHVKFKTCITLYVTHNKVFCTGETGVDGQNFVPLIY